MKKANIHIIAITALVLVFFAILFLATGNGQVNQNYTFKDQIEINTLPDYNTHLKIGSINIENNGIFPAKIKLKKYVICQLSDTYGDKTYKINYRGGSQISGSKEFISYNYNTKYVEISSNDKIELEMSPQFDKYDIKRTIDTYELNEATLPFYIFEVKEQTDNRYIDYFTYCSGLKKEDAYKTVFVTINISDEELESDKNIYY